jgi:hypothetical protein
MRHLTSILRIIATGIIIGLAMGMSITSCVVDESGGSSSGGQTKPPSQNLNPQVVRIKGFDGYERDIDVPANPVLRFPVADIIKGQAKVLGVNFSDEPILIGLSCFVDKYKSRRDMYLNMYNLKFKQEGSVLTVTNYAFNEDINIYAGVKREIIISSYGKAGILVEPWLRDGQNRVEAEKDERNLSLVRMYDTQMNRVNIFDKNGQFIGYLTRGEEANTIVESMFERDNRGMVIYNEQGNVIETKSLITNVQIKTISRPKDNPKPSV